MEDKRERLQFVDEIGPRLYSENGKDKDKDAWQYVKTESLY